MYSKLTSFVIDGSFLSLIKQIYKTIGNVLRNKIIHHALIFHISVIRSVAYVSRRGKNKETLEISKKQSGMLNQQPPVSGVYAHGTPGVQ